MAQPEAPAAEILFGKDFYSNVSLDSNFDELSNSSMQIAISLIAAVFVTSLISGVLGMAGGIILMAILTLTLTVSAAMVVHGAVQATANGSRAWFLRKHIQWQILPMYLIGAAVALSSFVAIGWRPSATLILLLIGLFPWLSLALPKSSPLVITNRSSQLLCGLLVSAAQLTAGASGPLLDLFYVNSKLDRHAIVATKAITQTLGHLFKLGVYGAYFSSYDDLKTEVPLWLIALALLSSITATRIGTRLLGRFSNETFRRTSQVIILALGALCMGTALSRIL